MEQNVRLALFHQKSTVPTCCPRTPTSCPRCSQSGSLGLFSSTGRNIELGIETGTTTTMNRPYSTEAEICVLRLGKRRSRTTSAVKRTHEVHEQHQIVEKEKHKYIFRSSSKGSRIQRDIFEDYWLSPTGTWTYSSGRHNISAITIIDPNRLRCSPRKNWLFS